MTTLLIATRNAHKVAEIQAILGNGFRCLTLDDLPGAPKVVEDAATFAGNATKKATELSRWLVSTNAATGVQSEDFAVLADDSGLEVDALGGAPGVHSARFAALERSADGSSAGGGGNSPDADNNAKLLRLLQDVPPAQRTARFRCVLARVAAGKVELFDGACEGRIALVASGAGGFGYDPLFIPAGFAQSFAELGEDVKNGISHRAKALAALKAALGS
jgi:XTP/dITP diphosphohydrolase